MKKAFLHILSELTRCGLCFVGVGVDGEALVMKEAPGVVDVAIAEDIFVLVMVDDTDCVKSL
jgi:hypothetical protein